jgi:hypothetical protein
MISSYKTKSLRARQWELSKEKLLSLGRVSHPQ